MKAKAIQILEQLRNELLADAADLLGDDLEKTNVEKIINQRIDKAAEQFGGDQTQNGDNDQ